MAKATSYWANIMKLHDFADKLEQGRRLHITRLMPIYRLVDSNEEMSSFFLFLLGQLLENQREPINLFRPMPRNKKLKFASAIKHFLKHGDRKDLLGVQILYEQCHEYSFGFKSPHVHTWREQCADADILLLCHIIWVIERIVSENRVEYDRWCYWPARYFCCDYAGFRYIPNEESAIRVRLIANYFSQVHGLSSSFLECRS